jgi:hypothetical protein
MKVEFTVLVNRLGDTGGLICFDRLGVQPNRRLEIRRGKRSEAQYVQMTEGDGSNNSGLDSR